jgi:hypothetical protein
MQGAREPLHNYANRDGALFGMGCARRAEESPGIVFDGARALQVRAGEVIGD